MTDSGSQAGFTSPSVVNRRAATLRISPAYRQEEVKARRNPPAVACPVSTSRITRVVLTIGVTSRPGVVFGSVMLTIIGTSGSRKIGVA